MTKISPLLAVAAGLQYPQLHILDGGGRPQLIIELTVDECHRLAELLAQVQPLEVVTVPAEEVAEAPPELPPSPEPEGPTELEQFAAALIPQEVPVEEVPAPVEAFDWASLTKAEIVATVLERFGEELDIHDLKDDLIHQAVELEQASAVAIEGPHAVA